ncbi:MAG TPA: MFS transporter [Methylomirabilota bacterium]|nr:MFS transporter [Methylomirabilota bacterium]
MSARSDRSVARGLRRPFPVFYGWVIVATAFVTMGLVVNARTAFSLLFPPILDEFGWARGVTAAAFAVGFLGGTLYAPFIGILMDRVGPRVVFPAGILLISAGLALATRVREPWHLYATLGVLVTGGSMAVSYIGHSLFLPNWFVRRRGLAIGIAFSGVGVGSITLLPWAQEIIGRAGWRTACWTLALLLLIVILPLNVLIPRQRPEELGLGPDGDAVLPGDGAGRRAADNVVDRAWASTDWTLGRAVRTARFWWVALAYLCGLFAWYAVQVHQTKYLTEIGFSPALAAYALGLVGLTGIVGQIALGHLSDRIGREWAWTLSGLGYVICYAVLLVMAEHPTRPLVYVMVASQGMLGYGLASVFGPIPAELFQGRHFGTIFGTLNLAAGAGAGLGPWVTGLVHDLTGSYAPAFWLAIGCSLVSVAAMWLAAPRKVRAVAGRIPRPRVAVDA